MVYKWLNNIHTRLFAPQCYLCGAPTSHLQNAVDFCPACCADLPRLQHSCHQCGSELAAANAGVCGQCLQRHPHFDRVISSFAYASPVKELMLQFKYRRQIALSPIFARSLLSAVSTHPLRVDALLPVPLHTSRLRQRGFNQSLELARPMAKSLAKPLIWKPIKRNKKTLTQATLTAKQRRQNLADAFVLKQPIPYTSIAIIDDIMTTGSTVNELARLLKLNGVEYIEVWCVARANIRSGI